MSFAEPDQLTMTTKKEFDELLAHEKSDGLILLTFVANWAGPCNLFDEALDKLERKRGNDILFLYCDLKDSPELAADYDCRAVPSFVLLKGGELVAGGAGAISSKRLSEWIDVRLEMDRLNRKKLTKGKK